MVLSKKEKAKKRYEAKVEASRRAVKYLEQALYKQPTRKLSADRRFAISMQLSTERAKLAKLLGISTWTADAALATPDEE